MFCDSQWTLAVLLFRCVFPFADWKFVFLNFGKSDAHARHVVDLFFAHVSCLVWANTWTHVLKQNRTTSTWQRSHGVPWYHLHTLRRGKSALFFHTSVHLAPTWGWPTNINASLNCHSSPKSGWCHSNISNVGATFCYHSSCCKSSGINVWCRWGINKLSISALTCKDSSICWRLHFARKLRAAKLRTETITCQRATCEGVQNAATKNRINSKLASNCQTNPVESRHVVEGFSFHILCFMLRCWSD